MLREQKVQCTCFYLNFPNRPLSSIQDLYKADRMEYPVTCFRSIRSKKWNLILTPLELTTILTEIFFLVEILFHVEKRVQSTVLNQPIQNGVWTFTKVLLF